MGGRRSDEPHWWSLLLWDDALVMTGAQFREVALPLLMVALWASSRSYALALFAIYLPTVVLAGWAGRLADRVDPRRLVLLSYVWRAAAVGVLALSPDLPVAVAAALALGAGTAAYRPAMTHYQAASEAGLNQVLVSRLRMVDSLAQAAMPLVAGAVITALGRGFGFLVSLVAYLAATAVVARLPARTRAPLAGRRPRAAPGLLVPRNVSRQMAVGGALSALAWIANVVYTAYILVDLRAGALGFGFALGVWGGAGLLSAALLPRVNPARPERVVTWLIVLMGFSWTVMVAPVGFWVVVALGVPEGFATFLLVDLIQTRVLIEAPSGERGQWQARSGAFSSGGRMAGLALAALVPALARVHRTFLLIALTAALLAAFWAASEDWRARRGPGSPEMGGSYDGMSPGPDT